VGGRGVAPCADHRRSVFLAAESRDPIAALLIDDERKQRPDEW